MEAKEEIYQYIRENIKEDGVTAQSIAEIFEIKRNVASHYLNLLEKEKRSLPWREDATPYHIWVSEIMLQQTRVEAVKRYYARFLEKLPTIEALAECEEEILLKLWEGLGYYNRVKNMQKAAKVIVEKYGGERDIIILLKVPHPDVF